MTTTNNTEFALQRIYAQVSSEVSEIPSVFEINEAPQLDVKLNINHQSYDANPDYYLVELSIVVNAIHKDKTLFLIEVKQGGIFKIKGFPEETLSQVINVHCPTILYPYASALVSDLVLRAGFMPLHLPPVDFNSMYEQKKEQQVVQTT